MAVCRSHFRLRDREIVTKAVTTSSVVEQPGPNSSRLPAQRSSRPSPACWWQAVGGVRPSRHSSPFSAKRSSSRRSRLSPFGVTR